MGVLPRTLVFSFWQDDGVLKMWKVSIGVEGTNQEIFSFPSSVLSSEYVKEDNDSNWPRVNKEGEDKYLRIFLDSFKICSGSKTPKCKGEVGFTLVPIFLVATVNHYLVKM